MNARCGWWWAAVAGTALFACSHAKSTAARAQENGTGGSGLEQAKPAPRAGQSLAETPAQLRKPGGTHEVARALHEKGYLQTTAPVPEAKLSEAIRAFQHDQGLAATGFADQETLKKLGLNPTDIDRSQAPRKGRQGPTPPRSP